MNNHKIRPKLKKYSKIGLFLNSKNQNSKILKAQKLKFYSPELVYLSPRRPVKVKQQFLASLINRKKLKFIFGFHRTTMLNKMLRKDLASNLNIRRQLRELEFCSLLERRLDVLLLRLGFVSTLFEAKHLISHKKIKINNLPNSCFSRLLRKGDVISFEPSIETMLRQRVKEQISKRNFFFNTFSNVEVNYNIFKIIVLTNKINISEQLHHYSQLLNWKLLL
jgi:ribosomal protein S4